jgi:hypothetical protein
MKSGLFGPMKDSSRCRLEQRELAGGRVALAIDHEPMSGVTPEMFRWWFEHFNGESNLTAGGFTGPMTPVYRLWHPLDHILVRWEKVLRGPDGRIAAGSVLYVEENLGGKHPSKTRVWVTRFDNTAFNFSLGKGAGSFGEVRHLFSPSPAGLQLRTEMDFGVQWPWIGPWFNRMLRRKAFTQDLITAWVTHNVEECGETERFLPQLYRHQAPS